MKIVLDTVADAALIHLTDATEAVEVTRTAMCRVEFERAAVILRLDKAGRLVGFEILGASRLLPLPVLARAAEGPDRDSR
jgi:uncharacterized protein YuzE